MTFTSFGFYIFLIAVVAVYYLLPLRFRWYSLLVGSIAFYWVVSENSIGKMVMLFGVAFFSWLFSILMGKYQKFRKGFLIMNLLLISIPLLAIKEISFAKQIFKFEEPMWWIVPIGIAFYSMQLIAYVVDVYKGKIEPEKNLLHFMLFVSFFPQIIQGPIPRYSQLANQLIEGHRFDEKKFTKGFMLILWGFFLKLCIADKAGIVVDTVFNNYSAYKGVYVIVAGTLYSFQLYTDFMACTSFAQGISELFGIDIIDNFNHPYFSTSIKDFWRRWHISLSSWLRDYIYIPLGGNRKGNVRKYINLLLTFAVSGIWHGAGTKFLVWGLLHGFYQVMGDIIYPFKVKIYDYFDDSGKKVLDRLCIFGTFILVTIAWIIFRAERLKTALLMLCSIITVRNPWIITNDALFKLGLGWKEWGILILCLGILLFVSKKQEAGISFRDKILEYNIVARWAIYIFAIVFIMVFGTYGFGYDPQAFIYGGF